MDDVPPHVCTAPAGLALLADLAGLTHTLRRMLAAGARPRGLSDIQLQLLDRCAAEQNGIAQRQLADALAISAAQVSHLVESLRRRDLIVGHRPAEDRRRQVWRLTPAGHQLLDEVMSDLAPRLADLLATVPPAAVARLSQTARQLNAAAATTPSLVEPSREVSIKRGAA
ncbi:MAG: winged helix DNA-binding protein [Planctomycetales bacterium]|nr:winged helix DNA-binding protein [Planctomycetales bacterium]